MNVEENDMITKEEALSRIKHEVRNSNLVKHMMAVSVIMRGLAIHLGEDPDLWEVVGLLHDIDYEAVGDDWNRHGLVSAEMVADDLPEEGIHAIRAHNPRTGAEAKNLIDLALIASDGLSGLIVATALMMPDKKLATVKVRSLRRKYKDSSFARGVSRENIKRCEELDMSIDEFFAIGLDSMQAVSNEIGL
jgi:putative nucleotidyltransferase with HDIG domain